jgi:peptidoglycan hydrolase CwlO-like protein
MLIKPKVEIYAQILAAIFGVVGSILALSNIWHSPRTGGYEQHQQMLDETKKNLENLSKYVDDQSRAVRVVNQALSKLKKEKDALEPLVNMNREQVNALFQVYEERQQAQRILYFLLFWG